MSRNQRIYSVIAGIVGVAAVLSPLIPDKDGFPLSNYPMFSSARSKAESTIYHAVGFDSSGQGRPLPPEVLGTDEVMQAYQTARIAIRRGRASSRALCERARDEVMEDDEFADIVRIELRKDVYDTMAYWRGERRPLQGRIAARCKVGSP